MVKHAVALSYLTFALGLLSMTVTPASSGEPPRALIHHLIAQFMAEEIKNGAFWDQAKDFPRNSAIMLLEFKITNTDYSAIARLLREKYGVLRPPIFSEAQYNQRIKKINQAFETHVFDLVRLTPNKEKKPGFVKCPSN